MGYRAGTDTGSMANLLMSGRSNVVPEVGMGATILMYSDRHAATIVAVDLSKKRKRITVQQDDAKRTDTNGFSESQDYDYTPNPDAPKVDYTLRKDGTWVKDGEPLKGGQRIRVGYREEYYDFTR